MNSRIAHIAPRLFLLLLWLGAGGGGALRGQGQDFKQASYRLLEGSTLVDDCTVCGRPTLLYVLRGTFDLVQKDSNPLFSTYEVKNARFSTGAFPGAPELTGAGVYVTGGEVAVQQRMVLELTYQGKQVTFSNEVAITDKLFPLISIELKDTAPTLLQEFTLKLVAAPARDIWFSTTAGFTPAAGGYHGTGGDLLSAEGRRVKTARELTAEFGFPGDAASLQVDALELQPGGEIWFSLDQDQPTSRVGGIQHGDLLSNRGRIVRRNQALTSSFGIMPVVPDVGLDAVMTLEDGEILFSITTSIFSERLGRQLRPGDLLSSRGIVVSGNAQMLSRFHPPAGTDFGLDALYVWPSGEIWFSLETGFMDRDLGPIGPGDLLSNQGIVILRNLDLMSAFAPIEDLADFGLDALFIVTDLRASAAEPRVTHIARREGQTLLEWEGAGRVFQVLRSARVEGPYEPVSPLLPDVSFDDTSAGSRSQFYRVRQW